jgi:PAS domain S-box-containing protein
MLKKTKMKKGTTPADQRNSWPHRHELKESALVIADITDLKNNDEYLAHLASIVESSDDAIISKSLDGMIKSWNRGSEKMFEFSEAEVIGKHISIIIPLEYLTEEREIVSRIRNNETIGHYETIRKKKNGEQLYVSLTVSPLKDKSGIIGVSKIIRDITSRKKAEANVIQTNAELVFQNEEKEKRAAELIIANKELAFQNKEKEKRAAELIIANKELAFQNVEKEKRAAELVIANTELAYQNEEKEKRAKELTVANQELLFQNKEKEMRAAELIIANHELAFQSAEKEKRASELVIANTELGFQNEEKENRASELLIANQELVFQNKEKENRAEELIKANHEVIERTLQLESANKELDSFSYSVSHDLRAPLRAVNGYARMLEEDYNALFDSEGKRLLREVQKNAERMGTLIDDLLAFSKLGKKEIKKSTVDMNALTKKVLSEIGQTTSHQAEIKMGNLNSIMADYALMEHVMTNLLSNAIKYSSKEKKPVVEIESRIDNGEIVFSVKDNGVGFDMLYADK